MKSTVKTLRKLREEIEKLEREKASLFEKIESLKAKGEERANKLRNEVETLRKEAGAFKEVIGARAERERPTKYKQKLAGIIGYVILLFGAASLIVSVPYTSSTLAFIGLGLTFWGALLLYIKPERYIKAELLNSTALSSLETINNILTELKYKGKAIYLPPKHLKGLKSGGVFIPSKNEIIIPPTEETAEETIFSRKPEGIFITPPGLALANLYEEKLGTSFTEQDIQYLPRKLAKLLIEDLETAEKVEIFILDNVVRVKITASIFQSLYKNTKKLPQTNASLGSPLLSSLAIVLTRSTGKPVIKERIKAFEDGKTVEAYYKIIEEQEL